MTLDFHWCSIWINLIFFLQTTLLFLVIEWKTCRAHEFLLSFLTIVQKENLGLWRTVELLCESSKTWWALFWGFGEKKSYWKQSWILLQLQFQFQPDQWVRLLFYFHINSLIIINRQQNVRILIYWKPLLTYAKI